MPLRRTAQQREPHPHEEQEEVEPGAKQPKLEPVAEERMEPGRPHQAFVENEARQYWQDMMQVDSLTKPTREEIRTCRHANSVSGTAQENRLVTLDHGSACR